MSATWVTFLFEVANFLLLAAVLGWFFFRPVRDVLERRRSEYEAERNAAEQDREKARQALAELHARRKEFEDSLDAIRARVKREAEDERKRILESAREEAERDRQAREREAVSQRRSEVETLALDAAYATRDLLVRLLERLGGPDLEQSLLERACREAEGLRAGGSLAPVVVESASELGEDAVATLSKATAVASGDLQTRIDPELVAGVRLLTARGLVDASVSGLAQQTARALASRLESEGSGDD